MNNARPALGRPRMHLRLTDSTNERARELAMAGAPHGTLVTASEQSAGRGRHGRSWSAPAGSGLLMSLVLRDAPRLLPLIAAVAVCDVCGAQALVKWPNDVVVRRTRSGDAGAGLAKLAGILVEGRPQEGWVVLGIGLNVAVRIEELPAELRGGADAGGGLPAATLGRPRSALEPTLAELLGALERRLAEQPACTLAAWRERDALAGSHVAWARGEGIARGIDGDGRLVVERADGSRTEIGSGEVHLQL